MTSPTSCPRAGRAVELSDESPERRQSAKAWMTGGIGLIVLAAVVTVRDVVTARTRRPKRPFSHQIMLEPLELAGPWWKRHRFWLTSPRPFTGTRYIVVNRRTGAAYPWRFKGNRRGRSWFGVRTRWAWVHPAWKRDPWILLYDESTVIADGSATSDGDALDVDAPDGNPDGRALRAVIRLLASANHVLALRANRRPTRHDAVRF